MTPYDQRRKRVLKRLFVGLTLFILSFGILGVWSVFFEGSIPGGEANNPLVWIFLTTLLSSLAYQPINHLYGWLFKHVFFPE